MLTILVSASRPYEVHIDSTGYAGLLARAFPRGGCRVAVVSDSCVFPLYGREVVNLLEDAGYSVISYVFPSGEQSKNGETYLSLLELLAQKEITRADVILSLGGGVAGDLAGFAAATYLRGVRLVHCPTSLLAMVDASVGGKTGIDLQSGKNLAGAFYQPEAVLCNPAVLKTLPQREFQSGCAEIIKYAMLGGPALASLAPGFDAETVIAQCVAQKAALVQEDEFDTGARQLLNFGHTVGHAIEQCSDYRISHGEAVAMGMRIITRAAQTLGLCEADCLTPLEAALSRFGLLLDCPYAAAALLQRMLRDKKRRGDTLTLVLPRYPGQCVCHPLPIAELPGFLAAGCR